MFKKTKILSRWSCSNSFKLGLKKFKFAKGLVAKLASPQAQTAWGSRGKRIWNFKKKNLYTILGGSKFILGGSN